VPLLVVQLAGAGFVAHGRVPAAGVAPPPAIVDAVRAQKKQLKQTYKEAKEAALAAASRYSDAAHRLKELQAAEGADKNEISALQAVGKEVGVVQTPPF
jgi:hypothetical protein